MDRRPGTLLREIGSVLAHYGGAQVRICLILSAIYGLGFALLGVPAWPLFALLCGFAHAIPMFGAVIAAVLTAGATWASAAAYRALGVVMVFAVAQGIEGFYLTPHIMGRQLHLPWWSVFFGLLVASSTFGFIGVLLAVPAMAIAVVIWRFLRNRTPASPPPAGLTDVRK